MWRSTSMLLVMCTVVALLNAAAVAQEPGTVRQGVAVWQPSAATVSKMQYMGFNVLERLDGSYLMLFPRGMTAESAINLLLSSIPELRDRRPTVVDPCAMLAHYCADK